MQKFERLTGVVATLLVDNIDTDQIIPVHRMLSSMNPDYGAGLFANWRYLDEAPDPAFVLNQPPFDRATVLIAGANFGCGSSREHAVWALLGFGIRCIIAPSFGDIFFNNCFKQGVLPIVLPAETVRAIAEEAATLESAHRLTIDLVACEILAPTGAVVAFEIDSSLRHVLLEGLDEIGQTLEHEDAIAAFQANDRRARPWIYRSTPAARRVGSRS
ncbi:MAG: 3-isopropylmalate dehydratase small subunit [Candidatus Binatia bacterium]